MWLVYSKEDLHGMVLHGLQALSGKGEVMRIWDRSKSRLLLQTSTLLLVGMTLASGSSAGGDEPVAKAKRIELAICLDVSNSMDGLIGSAKAKLWDIVNTLAKGQPTPELRVALYSYGCPRYPRETGWVRKELDFTTDLDKVNEKLFGLTTHGGDEYVARVVAAAVEELDWSKEDRVLKVLFVCGNEPATQDPQVTLEQAAEKAVRRGIIVNTILCDRESSPDAAGWKRLADLAEGRFACIDQDRGAVAVTTPFDKELADLSGRLNETYVFFGKEAKKLAERQVAQDANAAQAGLGVAAARAQAKAGQLYRFSENDLVQKLLDDPKFDVTKVAEADLPEELQRMKPADRQKHLENLAAKRKEVQKKVAELAAKREAYIAEQSRKQGQTAEQTFDTAIRQVLREQAAKKGIMIPN